MDLLGDLLTILLDGRYSECPTYIVVAGLLIKLNESFC